MFASCFLALQYLPRGVSARAQHDVAADRRDRDTRCRCLLAVLLAGCHPQQVRAWVQGQKIPQVRAEKTLGERNKMCFWREKQGTGRECE